MDSHPLLEFMGKPDCFRLWTPFGATHGGRREVGLVSGESGPPEEGERKSYGSTDAENVMALRAYSVGRPPRKAGAGAAILLLLRLLLPSSNLPRRCIHLWFPRPPPSCRRRLAFLYESSIPTNPQGDFPKRLSLFQLKCLTPISYARISPVQRFFAKMCLALELTRRDGRWGLREKQEGRRREGREWNGGILYCSDGVIKV